MARDGCSRETQASHVWGPKWAKDKKKNLFLWLYNSPCFVWSRYLRDLLINQKTRIAAKMSSMKRRFRAPFCIPSWHWEKWISHPLVSFVDNFAIFAKLWILSLTTTRWSGLAVIVTFKNKFKQKMSTFSCSFVAIFAAFELFFHFFGFNISLHYSGRFVGPTSSKCLEVHKVFKKADSREFVHCALFAET